MRRTTRRRNNHFFLIIALCGMLLLVPIVISIVSKKVWNLQSFAKVDPGQLDSSVSQNQPISSDLGVGNSSVGVPNEISAQPSPQPQGSANSSVGCQTDASGQCISDQNSEGAQATPVPENNQGDKSSQSNGTSERQNSSADKAGQAQTQQLPPPTDSPPPIWCPLFSFLPGCTPRPGMPQTSTGNKTGDTTASGCPLGFLCLFLDQQSAGGNAGVAVGSPQIQGKPVPGMAAAACVADGQSCQSDGMPCCSGNCGGGIFGFGTTCQKMVQTAMAVSSCANPGESCEGIGGKSCCSGSCDGSSFLTAGTCSVPGGTPTPTWTPKNTASVCPGGWAFDYTQQDAQNECTCTDKKPIKKTLSDGVTTIWCYSCTGTSCVRPQAPIATPMPGDVTACLHLATLTHTDPSHCYASNTLSSPQITITVQNIADIKKYAQSQFNSYNCKSDLLNCVTANGPNCPKCEALNALANMDANQLPSAGQLSQICKSAGIKLLNCGSQ